VVLEFAAGVHVSLAPVLGVCRGLMGVARVVAARALMKRLIYMLTTEGDRLVVLLRYWGSFVLPGCLR